MKTEEIIVANLKCLGCANTITGKLMEIEGVKKVAVENEQDSVTIEYEGTSNRDTFIEALASLGYPEATAANGLLMHLKSYASCVIGRMK